MNKNIINIAVKKFQELYKKYNGFINVGVDNWRGWRFVFDTEDVRKCKNNCKSCPLYFLLKNERITDFSAGLYPASKEDKELFGPQNFLNCKTLKQYENCYVNFILKKINSEKEIKEELMLVKDFKIIFSKENDNLKEKENEFKKSVIRKLLRKTESPKKLLIQKIVKKNKTIQDNHLI